MTERVVVLGAGLAGLSAADTLVDRGYEVILVERAPMAGGCTSSWIDHRDPLKRKIRKGQMQMNFQFYVNLNWKARKMLDGLGGLGGTDPRGVNWWEVGNAAYSDKLDGFHFFDQHGRRSHLSGTPKSFLGRLFRKLPAPFSAFQMLWDFDGMPRFRDKLSSARFFALAMLFGPMVVPPINDDENFYGVCKRLGMTHRAIEAMRRITYSITNLADADQVGPKFMHLFYEAMLRDRDSFGCRMMNDDCNDALIDPMVASLRARGVMVLINHAVRDFIIEGDRCRGVIVEDYSACPPEICRNCGLEQPYGFQRSMCLACGKPHDHRSSAYAPSVKRLETDRVISAMQPHQLAALYRDLDTHPLRGYPEFRALGQMKGAVLTVSRVFMDRKVTEGYNLTGLDRDFFSFNGAMDLSHIMPKYAGTSVFDTLSDDGEVLEFYPEADLKARLRADLARVFPTMDDGRVEGHLMAKIGPDVLYHRPVPRLNSRFLPKGPVTPVKGLYLAGDWVDEFELGKEAAVKSGIRAANAVLEADGRSDLDPILRPRVAPVVNWMQTNRISRFIVSRYLKRYRAELPPRRE